MDWQETTAYSQHVESGMFLVSQVLFMKTTQSKERSQLGFLQLFKLGALLGIGATFGLSAVTMRAEPPWSAPVTLSSPAINGGSPAVAVSDKGSMAATWVRQEGSFSVIQGSLYLNGKWTSPVNLAKNAFEPKVAIDRNGNATAVWAKGGLIQTSSSQSFTRPGWGTAVALSDVGLTASTPRVVADAAGNLIAIWVRYDINGVPGIETANRSVGGKWSAPLRIAQGVAKNLMLVVNARGDAAAIWDSGSSNAGIYVSVRASGNAWRPGPVWSAPYNVAPVAYRQGGGKIGIAANGDVTAGWRTNTDIRVADRTAVGGFWSATRTIYTSRSVSDYPTLAVSPSGDVMAAWITYVAVAGSYNYQINSAIRPVGGDWSTPALLTSNQEHDMELHAGTTQAGACVLSWVDVNSTSVKSATWTVKKGWYDFATIASGSDTALAVGEDTAVAIWFGGSFQAQVSTSPVP
jgi:hypothetical protein